MYAIRVREGYKILLQTLFVFPTIKRARMMRTQTRNELLGSGMIVEIIKREFKVVERKVA